MLCKGTFHWIEEARLAFEQLKSALMTPPALAMPNFKKEFVLECDASKEGIGGACAERASFGFH